MSFLCAIHMRKILLQKFSLCLLSWEIFFTEMSCLLLYTAYACVGHERMYIWIIYVFSKVFLLWMNHYSCIGLLWSLVQFTVSSISWSVFSPPKMFLSWGLFQISIAHNFQFSLAFWEMHHIAKTILGQRWTESCGSTKKMDPFCFYLWNWLQFGHS